jgi:uncharacterized protein (TIGR03083 family)
MSGPDTAELGAYVDIWWQAVADLTAVLEELPAGAWSAPTSLPGWTVHDVAAHTAHLEHILAGGVHDEVDVGRPAHVRSLQGTYTEQGVVARRDRTPAELVGEIRTSAATRRDALLAHPPADGSAPAPGVFGALGWSVRTLLRNRPLDVWMHEQDVRRAVDRPGNLDAPAALHSADYLAESLPYVLAKRVGAPPGTAVALRIAGHRPWTARIRDDGRGVREPGVADDAGATIDTDREAFLLLAGGRGTPADGAVRVAGDEALARRVLDHLAVTP